MSPSLGDPDEELKPTSFVPVYKGFTFTPRSNLTAYGVFADRSKLQDASLGGVYTLMNPTEGASEAAEIPYAADDGPSSETNAMARKMSKQTEGGESHFSSETEIHPCAGVPVDVPNGDIPTMNEHQEKSFEELETDRGIMEWNNSVFDERWLDPSPPNPKKPIDCGRPTTLGMITSKEIKPAFPKHQSWISLLQHLEETREKMDLSARFKPDPSIWGVADRSSTPEMVLGGKQPTRE